MRRVPRRRAGAPRETRRTGSGAGTRERLLDAAARLFAERGFTHVTVRQIAREAHANIAAVSYHFRDKLGLYTAVVQRAVAEVRRTSDAAIQAGAGGTPEEALRRYVRASLLAIEQQPHLAWTHKLLRHEMSEPTPAAPLIVEQAILPRIRFLGGIVAELLGCAPTDPRVRRGVLSIQAQVAFLLGLARAPAPFRALVVPDWPLSVAQSEALADHIAVFSLAGVRALAAPVDA